MNETQYSTFTHTDLLQAPKITHKYICAIENFLICLTVLKQQ